MKLRYFFVASLVLLLVAVNAGSQDGGNRKAFFFIQVTDPQFGMTDSNKSFTRETELYEKAVSAINRLNPDFVVITGDLVNKKGDSAQIAEFKRITAEIRKNIPVWYSPGNHDIGQPPTKADIDAFISNWGHDRFSFTHRKSLFIGLNSCLIKGGAPDMEKEQYDWLVKELSRNKNAKQKIIFTHYPFFIKTADEPEVYSNIPPETRMKYLDLFQREGVGLLFAGHLHGNYYSEYNGIKLVTTQACGVSHTNDPSGIRIVTVFPDRVESTFYGLDSIPAAFTPAFR